MQSKNTYKYSLIAPLMIVIAILGLAFRAERRKNFYAPIGIIGIYLIVEKEFHRRLKRKKIMNKINFFKNNK